jgi:hypothetical protein
MSVIHQLPAAYLLALQKRHIDERHSLGIEAEQKKIAHQGERAVGGQLCLL